MDYLIHRFENFSLWRISCKSLLEVSKFIVETNYNKHSGIYPLNINDEIREIYEKEKKQFDNSFFYVVRDDLGNIIGVIRALKWNGITELPIQTIFNVDIEEIKRKESEAKEIWHIGCFAIDTQSIGRASIVILKILLAQAIFHICTNDSIMLAECDRKLFEKIKLLNICSCEAGESQYYIGSETVPVYNTSNQLKYFLWKQRNHLYINGIESIFPMKNREESEIIELFSEEPAWAV